MKPMWVTPEQLARAGRQLGRCAQDFGTELKSLQSTVTTDNPWGSDEPGTLFGMAYVEVLDHAMEVYASHVDQLVEAADKLADWANRNVRTEQDATGRFEALRVQLG